MRDPCVACSSDRTLVTFWGVNDGVSWRAAGKPLLFDADDKPKPAFEAVIRAADGN